MRAVKLTFIVCRLGIWIWDCAFVVRLCARNRYVLGICAANTYALAGSKIECLGTPPDLMLFASLLVRQQIYSHHRGGLRREACQSQRGGRSSTLRVYAL